MNLSLLEPQAVQYRYSVVNTQNFSHFHLWKHSRRFSRAEPRLWLSNKLTSDPATLPDCLELLHLLLVVNAFLLRYRFAECMRVQSFFKITLGQADLWHWKLKWERKETNGRWHGVSIHNLGQACRCSELQKVYIVAFFLCVSASSS